MPEPSDLNVKLTELHDELEAGSIDHAAAYRDLVGWLTGRTSDPRLLGGDIAVAGRLTERHNAAIDTTNAVLMDGCIVARIETRPTRGEPGVALAMLLEGRINRTQDRARVLFVFDEDGAAAIVSELVTLAYRLGPAFGDRLMDRIKTIMAEQRQAELERRRRREGPPE
jgi:hypothetical protein